MTVPFKPTLDDPLVAALLRQQSPQTLPQFLGSFPKPQPAGLPPMLEALRNPKPVGDALADALIGTPQDQLMGLAGGGVMTVAGKVAGAPVSAAVNTGKKALGRALKLVRGAETQPIAATATSRSPAALERAQRIVQMIEESNGITLDPRTLERSTQGYAVAGLLPEPRGVPKLTPEHILSVLDQVPGDAHLGAWADRGKWFIEPAQVVPDLTEAVSLGVTRKQKAVGDLAKYAQSGGKEGTIRLLKHRTPNQLEGEVFDPSRMGTGLPGAERARPNRPGAVHFYGMRDRVEPQFQSLPEFYTFVADEKLADISNPEIRKLLGRSGDPERKLIKLGYHGLYDSERPGAYKLFVESPIVRRGENVTRQPFTPKAGSVADQIVEAAPTVPIRPRNAPGVPPTPEQIAEVMPDPKRVGSLLDAKASGVIQPSSDQLVRATGKQTAPAKAKAAETLSRFEQTLRSPEVLEEIKAGVAAGGHEWYNTNPAAKLFVQELGPEEGLKRFKEFADLSSAASIGTNPSSELRFASMLYYLKQNGKLPSAEALRSGSIALPKGYIHHYQGNVNRLVADLIDQGALNPMKNPKPAAYAGNKTGNWNNLTADRHFTRMAGLPGDSPDPQLYGQIEDIARAYAQELADAGVLPVPEGMSPLAALQSAGWVGAAKRTGVHADASPWWAMFEDRILRTADKTGLSPQEIGKGFVRGQWPLLGVGGMAAIGSQLPPEVRRRMRSRDTTPRQ